MVDDDDDDDDDDDQMVFKRASDATGERIPLAKKKSNASSSSSSSRRQTLPFYVAPREAVLLLDPESASRRAPRRVRARRRRERVRAQKEETRRATGRAHVAVPVDTGAAASGSFRRTALRRHRKLPRAFVDGYTVSTHPNDLPAHVLDEWDPRRLAAVERERARGARRRDGDDGDHGDDGARGDDAREKRGEDQKVETLRRIQVRSIHWSPYDGVRVVNAVP